MYEEATFMDAPKMLKVSDMAENLKGSEIIQLANQIKEKTNDGDEIYNFTIGDFNPDIFPIPNELKEGIINAFNNNETNYPTANGLVELRQAVSRFLHTRGGLEYNEDQILIAGGARPLIYAAYQAVVDPGDSVFCPLPSWNNNHYCHLTRAKAIFVETSAKNNFMPSAENIKPYISNISLIALCSPLNPTGTTFSRQQLDEICQLVLEENKKRGEYKKPVFVLYDQIYWQLTHGGTMHQDPVSLYPEMKNYTIFVDGISKAFAATGVRVGWGFGPEKVITKMKSILSHVGAWSPRAEQVATANYLGNDKAIDKYMNNFKGEINQRLTAFYEGFMNLKEQGFPVDAIAPQAAMFLTVKLNIQGMRSPIGRLTATEDVTEYLLQEAKIALVPFHAFGASRSSSWFRLAVGTCTMEDIQGFLANLKRSLEQLT